MKQVVLLLLFACLASASLLELGRAPDCIVSRTCLSRDWAMKERVDPETQIKLIFALKLQNLDILEKTLYEISTPGSAKYGKHMTFEEVGRMTTSPIHEPIVRTWLLSQGVHNADMHATLNRDYLVATMPARVAEKVLSTQFFSFFSESQGTTISRTLAYSVPSFIASHIDFIGNTVQFPPKRVKFGYYSNSTDASGSTTPALLSSFYKITSDSVASAKATQSLFEALKQYFSPTDLKSFQSQFSLPAQAVTKVVGTNLPASCNSNPNNCVEANLDVQYIMAIAQGSPTWFWSIGGEGDIFLEWIVAVQNTTAPPLVHSISYGGIETEEDPTSAQRFSTAAQQLGAQGVTIMVASGDDGVANYEARSDPSKCGFNPSFPASVPYIVAVGATQGPEDDKPEIMCSSSTGGLITSGGGFSTIFTTPSYQATNVASYLKNGPNLPPISMFNSKGRGYPDVAAMGHNFEEVIGGSTYQVSGTSAASPTFAGMVTLVNGLRMAKGKSSLGFMNPALYNLASTVYNDITSGTNNCCAGNPGQQTCCKYGFTASTGWDPTTGLGSVNFATWSVALVAL